MLHSLSSQQEHSTSSRDQTKYTSSYPQNQSPNHHTAPSTNSSSRSSHPILQLYFNLLRGYWWRCGWFRSLGGVWSLEVRNVIGGWLWVWVVGRLFGCLGKAWIKGMVRSKETKPWMKLLTCSRALAYAPFFAVTTSWVCALFYRRVMIAIYPFRKHLHLAPAFLISMKLKSVAPLPKMPSPLVRRGHKNWQTLLVRRRRQKSTRSALCWKESVIPNHEFYISVPYDGSFIDFTFCDVQWFLTI